MAGINWAERREDYALRPAPDRYRMWSWVSIFGYVGGVSTALFFLAWGGTLALSYGTPNLIWGMIFGTIVIGTIGYYLALVSSETGLDSDLITRGAGYGFLGSSLTSLIYSFNFVMFSAFEGTIMANAIHTGFPSIPMDVLYIIIGLVFIPITWYGLTVINWLMWVTIPLYIAFLIYTIVHVVHTTPPVPWLSYMPKHIANPAAGPALLQVMATVAALMTNATISADIGRFLPKERRRIGAFFTGFVFELVTFMVLTLLGAFLALRFKGQTDPGIYLASVLGGWGVLFVIVTQLRINATNTYSGSLAYSNFFSRVFHWTPGRHWWVVLQCAVSTLLMFGGIFSKLSQVLTFEGVFSIAWIMTVVSDLLINKRLLKISPADIEFRRSQLPNFNPVGVGSLLIALVPSVPLAFGLAGPYGMTLAPFISGAIGLVCPPIIALLTRGKTYAQASKASPIAHAGTETCGVCHKDYETSEMVRCPFIQAPICSVCCAAEARCHDMCKAALSVAEVAHGA